MPRIVRNAVRHQLVDAGGARGVSDAKAAGQFEVKTGPRSRGRAGPSCRVTMLRARGIASGVLAPLLVAGCALAGPSSPTGEPAALHIVNLDGPDVSVVLGGAVIATVPCGGSTALVPGTQLPGQPWDLTIRTAGGEVLGSVSIAGPLPQGILVRGHCVLTGPWPMTYGPAPSPLEAPCGTSPPATG